MAQSYAARLTHGAVDLGECGLPERIETSRTMTMKINQLTELIRSSSNIVVHTGAGISTASGIPDFRGTNGVWTLQQSGHELATTKIKVEDTSFADALPTYTHMALLKLWEAGKVSHIVTQVGCLL